MNHGCVMAYAASPQFVWQRSRHEGQSSRVASNQAGDGLTIVYKYVAAHTVMTVPGGQGEEEREHISTLSADWRRRRLAQAQTAIVGVPASTAMARMIDQR
jgi:hypothetical protein